VARFVAGDVVVVPFPFTDLASSKVRPAVVLATSMRDDILLRQVTSKDTRHGPSGSRCSQDDRLRRCGKIAPRQFSLPSR